MLCTVLFTHSSFFAVSQIWSMDPGIKIRHSDPSIESNTKIIRQIEQIFEPNCMLFKELKEKRCSSHHSVSTKKIKTLKNTTTLFVGREGRRWIIRGFSLFAGIFEPNPQVKARDEYSVSIVSFIERNISFKTCQWDIFLNACWKMWS